MPSLRRSDEKRILDEIEKSYGDKTPRTQIEITKDNMKALAPAFDRVAVHLPLNGRSTGWST